MTGVGDPASRRLVVFCHPMPGASGFDPEPELTRHWGVHLLGVDRPGYSSSAPWAEGEAPDAGLWARDLGAWVLRTVGEGDDTSALTYDRTVGVLGWGAGAVYAAELAVVLGDRVDRLALIEPITGPSEADPPAGAVGLRLQRMLDDAALSGDAGVRGDEQALRTVRWPDVLGEVDASTLIVARDDGSSRLRARSADAAELRRVRGDRPTRVAISRSRLPIVAHWRRILEHVAPEHGQLPEEAR